MSIWPGIGEVDPLAPGVYVDRDGNVHFDVPEILRSLGADNTAENRQTVAKALVDEARRTVARVQVEDMGVVG